MNCMAMVLGPDRTRDGRLVTRRCRRPATVTITIRKDHPQGAYDSISEYCDRHAPKEVP